MEEENQDNQTELNTVASLFTKKMNIVYAQMQTKWKEMVEPWWSRRSNVEKVGCASIGSVLIFLFICLPAIVINPDASAGFWNFIILLVSSPVAFAIWHFRDENSKHQIDNQRKDINLKEFQKLSEWVSGAHFPEMKISEKSIAKNYGSNNQDNNDRISETITEQSKEYSKSLKNTQFSTFSKWEGAVALQISAVYNLLPFFRGEYGESFRRPAFNLLKSAWQAMQQDSLNRLEDENLSDDEKEQIIHELQDKARSPLGVALTQVLLSLNKDNTEANLRAFPEMLPNICLAGMDFHTAGVDEKARNLSGLVLNQAQLQGANMWSINFIGAQLRSANCYQANLRWAILQRADLNGVLLNKANLSEASLHESDLSGASLQEVRAYTPFQENGYIIWSVLEKAKSLFMAKITERKFLKEIYPEWKKNHPIFKDKEDDERVLSDAMEIFEKETGVMLINEKKGK